MRLSNLQFMTMAASAAMTVFTACSDDDDPTPNPNPNPNPEPEPEPSTGIYSSALFTAEANHNTINFDFSGTFTDGFFGTIDGGGHAISGLTLGLAGQAHLPAQLGRNEAWNHAGNAASAVLGGAVGWFYGIGGVLLVMAGMGLLSLLAVRGIQPQHIDYAAARGLETAERARMAGPVPSRLSLLFGDKALLCTGGIMLFFHLGNAAMLPLLGQSAVAHFDVDPAVYTACTVLVAQGTMILTALWAAWLAPRRGYGPALFCALIALPIRGLIAGFWQSPWNIVPVQILDGVGAGIMGVVTPGMVALLLRGSGHINLGLGMVMTLQGIGAAFSSTWGGVVAGRYGYSMAFLALAVAPCVALLLLLAGIRFLPRLRDALSRHERRRA